MFKVLVPAVAALGLVAFAAQSRDVAPAGEDEGVMAAPVMSWSVHHEGALAKLAYGVANSDQLALMVTCMPGESTAAVYGDVQLDGARVQQARYSIDPLSGGDAEETLISINDPSLAGLARDGRMTVTGDAGRFQLAASTDERRIVRDFLAYCSPGRA
ncbi:hypothetical protein [Brevundimonas sp. NIBR11]|uniref:hypothetical protein n=1 Tax=Brevundimonas sp. NIBR11 TaxID=3015999 RepID=UPI0022F06B85|nr:hypothetical protein [Brevundimonas sp. NIBR11]WGM31813.1 hypothetical protein KKHFBJBL_02062 [Brevundimonas sp. NIBR11]